MPRGSRIEMLLARPERCRRRLLQHHVEEKQRKRRTDERKHHPMWIAFASAAWPSSAKAKSTN